MVSLLGAFVFANPSAGSEAGAVGARPSLYVYLPIEAKSAVVEEMLKKRLSGLAITVFGRFRDFDEALQRSQPDAILAPQPLLARRKIPVTLQGLRGDQDSEPYVLVSRAPALTGSLAGKIIGVVDVLGREGTQASAAEMLGTQDIKLKRVTKMEDLLPLLQFSAAEAVLVPQAAVEAMRARSRLQLQVRELHASAGLVAVAVLKPSAQMAVVRQFQALDAPSNRLLGVERWRGP